MQDIQLDNEQDAIETMLALLNRRSRHGVLFTNAVREKRSKYEECFDRVNQNHYICSAFRNHFITISTWFVDFPRTSSDSRQN